MNTPDYMLIVDDIRARIADGRLRPGEALPSYREMADQYDLSISTVGRAVMVAKALGLVVGKQGRATYVAPTMPPKLEGDQFRGSST